MKKEDGSTIFLAKTTIKRLQNRRKYPKQPYEEILSQILDELSPRIEESPELIMKKNPAPELN
jgi:hypothetical protein